jgi:LysR family hydrogen peroxide-inducible transcriptional activator
MNRDSEPGTTLVQLRALVAVAETLHFGDAAAVLGRSQPAVSAAIAALEAALGARLLERTTRNVILTAAGEETVSRARQILGSVEELRRSATTRELLSGPLRLGIIPTVAPYVLPALALRLRQDAPALTPEITEDQTARLLTALRQGRLDALLLALPAEMSWAREIALYQEEFLLAVPAGHELDGAVHVSHDVLSSIELLLLQEGHCLRDQVLEVCRKNHASVTHPAHATSLTTLTQLVAARFGTTLLPATAVSAETGARVGLATLASPAPGRTIGLVHRTAPGRTDEFTALADIVRAAVTDAELPVELLSPGRAGRS